MGCKQPCPPNLQHKVVVNNEAPVDDGAGGTSNDFALKFEMWTYFTNLTGSEQFKHQRIQSEATHKLTARYRADLMTTDQIVFRGVQYNITFIDNTDMLNQWMIVYMKSGVVQ